jgi:hypothetical protein
VEAWNRWRRDNSEIEPDLRDSDLYEADLRDADLRGAILSGATLSGAIFDNAHLRGALLGGAKLGGADLTAADLGGADLHQAKLSRANLCEADFKGTIIGWTIFTDNDLSAVNGLDTVVHDGPSSVGIDTLFKSQGHIPPGFLRGCGLSDWQVEAAKLHQPSLTNEEVGDILYRVHDLRASRPLQISSLFDHLE